MFKIIIKKKIFKIRINRGDWIEKRKEKKYCFEFRIGCG